MVWYSCGVGEKHFSFVYIYWRSLAAWNLLSLSLYQSINQSSYPSPRLQLSICNSYSQKETSYISIHPNVSHHQHQTTFKMGSVFFPYKARKDYDDLTRYAPTKPVPVNQPKIHYTNMDAQSTYSASTTYSSKPLVTSSDESTSKRSKVWAKTKKILAAIPEPERESRPAVVGPETEEQRLKRLRKFGELDYGTYQGHAGRIR
jgi:hypothetical protein